MDELMLKIENVSKTYKLGQIGGTTLKDELQRLSAKLHKREDPTKKIGAKDYNKGEIFNALSNLSFEVKKGERVGIIGHNGAGKSTLLKLISRVTAPSNGTISLNGRVTSMLEVGTGFHGELTGRENIYMNGAILGMTKKEIDDKMEDIIEFSECRQFIDTPVKRYSSGMYVKLAFSVAAHLDSEIMIMDEVLAVGDMAFQKKCLDKMNEVSKNDGRTILYVSHNMNTIRQLCNRCIVLEHGKVVFNGSVEDGIAVYMNTYNGTTDTVYEFADAERSYAEYGKKVVINSLKLLDKETAVYDRKEKFVFSINCDALEDVEDLRFYIRLFNRAGECVGVAQTLSKIATIKKGENATYILSLDISNLAAGSYSFQPDIYWLDKKNFHHTLDHPVRSIMFDIVDNYPEGMRWQHYFASVRLNEIEVIHE